MSVKKYFYYTWEQYSYDVRKIVSDLNIDFTQYHSLAPVAFGGLILGTTLKNIYHLPTRIIFASSYHQEKQTKLKIKVGNLKKLKPKVLIIDDISDTGNTIYSITKFLDTQNISYDTLTIFFKETSKYKPTYYLYEISHNIWVHFPWEHV